MNEIHMQDRNVEEKKKQGDLTVKHKHTYLSLKDKGNQSDKQYQRTQSFIFHNKFKHISSNYQIDIMNLSTIFTIFLTYHTEYITALNNDMGMFSSFMGDVSVKIVEQENIKQLSTSLKSTNQGKTCIKT